MKGHMEGLTSQDVYLSVHTTIPLCPLPTYPHTQCRAVITRSRMLSAPQPVDRKGTTKHALLRDDY